MTLQAEQIAEPICDSSPDWIDLYRAVWKIAADNVEQPNSPDWKPQMTCMPGTGIIWLWDSCFMPFFARYGGGAVPVMNNLDNLYRQQREDGFIAMAYEVVTETPAYGERVNPPLLAWTELEYWRFSGDESRLVTVVPKLVRFFDWIKENRRRQTGLYWFEDSGSTGMDNSPRSGYFATHLDGSDICHVDLIAQQALAARCIAELSRHMGETAQAARFDREHQEITVLLNLFHWDERSGFYYDVFHRDCATERHNYLNHKTVAAFWPMMAGCCSPAQVEVLVRHLMDPDEFWTKHPVASLSKDDPNFDPAGAYWLGGVWPPIEYMLTRALAANGHRDLARKLAVAHLEAMSAVFQSTEYSGIWEAYAPDSFLPSTKKPTIDFDGCSPFALGPNTIVKENFVGWGGLGPVAMLIETVFGMEFDAPAAKVVWDIRTKGRHGLKDLQFAGGTISLTTSELSKKGVPVGVEVSLTVPLTLVFHVQGAFAHRVDLTPGNHALKILT